MRGRAPVLGMGCSDANVNGGARLSLFGRDSEMGLLAAALSAVGEGRGQAIVVSGDAGTGKSRLLEELETMARDAPMQVLHARCTASGSQIPFELVMRLLARLEGDSPGSPIAQQAWAALEQQRHGRPVSDSDHDRLFHAIHWSLVGHARERPLALIVHRADLADAPSARVIEHVAARLDDVKLLLAVSVACQTSGAGARLARGLLRGSNAMSVELGPLDRDGVAVAVASAGLGMDPGLVDACTEVTAGSPVLVAELLCELGRVGAGAVAPARLGELVPPGIARRVAATLADGGDRAARLVEALFVLGEWATAELVRTVAGLRPTEVPGITEELTLAGLLARPDALASEPTLRLRAPLVRSAIAAGADPERLAATRLRAAAALRSVGAPDADVSALLLLMSPSGSAEAAALLLSCARGALARGDPEDAVRLLRRALEEPPGDGLERDVALELAAAEAALGIRDGKRRHDRVVAGMDDPFERAAALERLGAALAASGDRRGAESAYRKALDDVEPGADRAQLERLATGYAAVALDVPELAGQARTRIADWLGDGVGLTPALAVRIAVARARREGSAESALELVRWSVARGLGSARMPEVVDSLALAVAVPIWCDDLALAREVAGLLAGPARAAGARAVASVGAYQALACLTQGRIGEAVEGSSAAATLARRTGCRLVAARAGAVFALALLERGDRVQAAEVIAEASAVDPGRGEQSYSLAEAAGWVALADQDAARAIEHFRLAGEHAAAIGVDNPAIAGYDLGTVTCLVRLGRDDEAAELGAATIARLRGFGARRQLANALRVVATANRHETGAAMLEEALAALSGSTAELERARCLLASGATLRRLHRRAEASDRLRLALHLASRMGATVLAQRARSELLATGARPRRAALAGRDALTPSERRIAQLAGAGYANREIADTLFVTVKTVEWHLHNVFMKLDVGTRAKLAAALTVHEGPLALHEGPAS